MEILVTGGAGYIGSHTCVLLLEAGYDVSVVDNLSNSSDIALDRVREITGRPLYFYREDLGDRKAMDAVFRDRPFDAVIHFAGLKAVGESADIPLAYYRNNVGGTISLLEAMGAADVKTLVFSSSATVYGDPETVPIREDFPVSATNPYGKTKLMIEWIIDDLCRSDPQWNTAVLRYFNPVGAHPSGRIGEDPADIPNNLMPYVSQVAIGKLSELSVFGNDYPTPDGTGVRDYIHVMDLAAGHLHALEALFSDSGSFTCNLGTGRGYSVLEMIRAFERASGKTVPYRITGRRPGDIATCYADVSLAESMLGWKALRGIDEMCDSAWHWQKNNPEGYRQE